MLKCKLLSIPKKYQKIEEVLNDARAVAVGIRIQYITQAGNLYSFFYEE